MDIKFTPEELYYIHKEVIENNNVVMLKSWNLYNNISAITLYNELKNIDFSKVDCSNLILNYEHVIIYRDSFFNKLKRIAFNKKINNYIGNNNE